MKPNYVYITASGTPDTVIMGMVAVTPSWGLVLALIYAGIFKKDTRIVITAPFVAQK